MLTCVIIDDEPLAIDILDGYIRRTPHLQLVGTATDPAIGIQLLRNNPVDVVFLDIQMDEVNGIDLLKRMGRKTKAIFCTAFSEFAVASYELEAVDYLMKPISYTRFEKAVQRLQAVMQNENYHTGAPAGDYVFIKTEQKGKMLKINLDEIDYVEGKSNYVSIHRGKEKILVYSSMKELEDRLPPQLFMRVHKSYIIALKQITTVENGELVMKNRTERIPISQTYRALFMERLRSKFLHQGQ